MQPGIGIQDKRPPYVRFEEREYGVNHDATKLAGRPIPKVVDFACITPAGSRDVFEKVATEWLEQIEKAALTGNYPLEWAQFFKAAYEAWKKGNELPREGTPIKSWSALTKEQASRLIALGIPTVEDLAVHPDSSLGQIGPDGRYLRDLAKGWLTEAKDKGINAREIASLKLRCSEQETTISGLRERLAALEQKLSERPRIGRPPKAKGLMNEDAA